jgi:uncharacterized protein
MNPNTRTVLLADWMDVAFIHFRVGPHALQPRVPLELDLFDGDAYVSLVSFTQRRLRPMFGGRLAALLATPLAEHRFLNVRTYVKHEGDRGIYFLAEWIPNRLAQLIGPRLYGLPYRLGRLENHLARRSVHSRGRSLNFTLERVAGGREVPDRDEFLVERYIAYTYRDGVLRRFDVAHDRWRLTPMDVIIGRADLLNEVAPFLHGIVPSSADYSAGVTDVRISMPRRIERFTWPTAPARRNPCRLRRSGNVGCP